MARFALQLREALNRKYMNEAGADGADGGQGGNNSQDGTDNNDSNNNQNDGGDGHQSNDGNSGAFSLSDADLQAAKLEYANAENGEIDLSRLFGDLHQAKAGRAAPETYTHDFLSQSEEFKDYSIPVDDDPLIAAASEWAKEFGVPQEQYEKLVGNTLMKVRDIQTQMNQDAEAKATEAWAAIPDAEARKGNLTAQLNGMLGDEHKEHVEALVNSPEGFALLEKLAAKTRDPSINTSQVQTPSISRDDVQVLRSQRDEAEQAGNSALVREIEGKISKHYSALSQAGKL